MKIQLMSGGQPERKDPPKGTESGQCPVVVTVPGITPTKIFQD